MSKEAKKYYAGVGNPSPPAFFTAIFNAAFAATGKDAEFVPILVKREYLNKFLVKSRDFLSGMLVFPPHEQKILPLCDKRTENAQTLGAVQIVNIDPDTNQTTGDAVVPSDTDTEQEKALKICIHAYETWFNEPAPVDAMRRELARQSEN